MARKDVNITVTMETDAVFIGDIWYALDKGIYHEKWGEGLGWADGEIRAEGNGDRGPVCAVVGSTAFGDGCFAGSDGTEFGVDAGVIGVTNLRYRRRDEDCDDASLARLGKLVNIPGGKCFVTLIDESGDFYIIIEDMKHNKIYSVSISTGYEEKYTCSECGEEISDFENNCYGGVCESCYRKSMYGSDDEEEEDLYECCDASCTSAEFQRMAPGKNAKMIGMKKRSLGKKDKYNTLGEKSLKESKSSLKENANAQDKVLVKVHIPNDYYDEYGNPVNAEKYDERLEEIDKVLFEAGADTVWEVTSDPEAGWEGDEFNDTGFRRMTIAQLQVAIENGGIEEDEIRVYDNDIDVSRDDWIEYMNKHPEIDPWDYTTDYDIYEDHRIHDVYSLVFDADDATAENSTEKPLLQRMLQDGYTEEEAKDMAEYTGLDINDSVGFDDYVKLRDDWLVWTGRADKNV